MAKPVRDSRPPICNYEGSSYRVDFWDGHGRQYEDAAERRALRRLLPAGGHRLVELGAGFGRLADLYAGYDQVILLDYAKSGLREARQRLAGSDRFIFVAADVYHLPIAPCTCDTVVTVRVLHHMADVPAVLQGIARILRPDGTYVLEYANKRNIKAVARYLLKRQRWSPFNEEPYEFVELNFDFHPAWMARQLAAAGFAVEAGLSVSHFRHPLLKRLVPTSALVALDAALQVPTAPVKLAPSVFLRAHPTGQSAADPAALFCCPACGAQPLQPADQSLVCLQCGAAWGTADGIYDFVTPLRHPGPISAELVTETTVRNQSGD